MMQMNLTAKTENEAMMLSSMLVINCIQKAKLITPRNQYEVTRRPPVIVHDDDHYLATQVKQCPTERAAFELQYYSDSSTNSVGRHRKPFEPSKTFH